MYGLNAQLQNEPKYIQGDNLFLNFSCCTEGNSDIQICNLFHLESDTKGANYHITITTSSFSKKGFCVLNSFPLHLFFLFFIFCFICQSLPICFILLPNILYHGRVCMNCISAAICNFQTKSNRIHQLHSWLPDTYTWQERTPKWFK